jgi:hypothetical protein
MTPFETASLQLSAAERHRWLEPNAPDGITTDAVYIGPDDHLLGFSVAVAESLDPPTPRQMRELRSLRKGNAAPGAHRGGPPGSLDGGGRREAVMAQACVSSP